MRPGMKSRIPTVPRLRYSRCSTGARLSREARSTASQKSWMSLVMSFAESGSACGVAATVSISPAARRRDASTRLTSAMNAAASAVPVRAARNVAPSPLTSMMPSSRLSSAESRPRNTAFCSDVGSRKTTESRTRVTDTKRTGSLPSACQVPPALSSVTVIRDGGDAGKRTSPSQRPATEWVTRSATGVPTGDPPPCAQAHTIAADRRRNARRARQTGRRMESSEPK